MKTPNILQLIHFRLDRESFIRENTVRKPAEH